VVIVRDPHMLDGGPARTGSVQMWLTRAMERLTGRRGVEAWKCVFDPADRVAIKVNAVGGPGIATSPMVALAVARNLLEAGVSPRNIVIFDRTGSELRKAGYELRMDGEGPLCFGTDRNGYESLPRIHGSIGSCFSPVLTRWATALVNVPVLKDHDLSGVSLSMKNLYGVIHNPNKYHDSGCSPYLADLLDHPEVRDKHRLTVIDAHRAQCQGGPAHAPRWVWPFGGLLVGSDAVAVDAVGAGIIEGRRGELGLPSLQEAGRPAVHIQTAAERGLGEGRREAIRVYEMGG
jgi:uncharacterized protein (DUF362 family)